MAPSTRKVTRTVPAEGPGPIGGEDALTARSIAPGDWLWAVILVVAVFLVYQPVWQGGFLFDDNLLLLDNPVLRPGGLAKVWAPGGYLNYWPLTYTAYWLEFKMWGLPRWGSIS